MASSGATAFHTSSSGPGFRFGFDFGSGLGAPASLEMRYEVTCPRGKVLEPERGVCPLLGASDDQPVHRSQSMKRSVSVQRVGWMVGQMKRKE